MSKSLPLPIIFWEKSQGCVDPQENHRPLAQPELEWKLDIISDKPFS